jgi:isochorismate pyruvate lyase
LNPASPARPDAERDRRFTGVRDQMRGARIAGFAAKATLDSGARRGQGGGMSDFLLPEDCKTMREVRAGVDATDRELMALLDRRFGYMRAAARIKTDRATVRDEARKAEVIANVVTDAVARALPVEVLATIWDRLVEASIAYELSEWDRLNAASAPRSVRGR